MLKRTIAYEDFEGNETSDIFYFNLSKPELVELEAEYAGGFGKLLENIVESKNNREVIRQFKEIILMAYGVKSPDGKRFIKNDELREEFTQTAAFQALFMELMESEGKMVEFVEAVMPRDLVQQVKDQDKPATPPVTTADPTSDTTPREGA